MTDHLVTRGILILGKYDLIWIMGPHRNLTKGGPPLRDVKQLLAGALVNNVIPAPRDVIMSLADA